MCLVIYVYGDDGGDEKKERVLAVSVVAGLEEDWQELEAKWIPRCARIPFHAKDCETDNGDYRCIPHDKNKAMYRDLVSIVVDSRLHGAAIAIDLTAQLQIFPASLDLAYYRAFLEALQRTAAAAERFGDVAELTFDSSNENKYNAGLLYSYMRKGDSKLLTWLHQRISFAQARYSARLQVADLLAYEGWKALDHTVGPIKRHRRSWEALRATERFETYSYSTDWFTDLQKHIQSGELERQVKFNQQDYINWLKLAGRQANLSNLFTFLDRMRTRDESEKDKGKPKR
jgi:hypothetical protein